ncbi:MAG: DNA polymerase I [Candidatus Yanofskybacteria bacterium RIFCSPLOWO2_02_FULL_43_10]|uniref:DNA polymerase I n=1 Tax=Candidatus Yanofskybacteria bacterium RIFCSPLOWO2_12_FULL_43_11b TaxID=1802710 RepID=A0A1F8H9L0_9BACT|nr:MAG: DNA polymerase I [Candidatus Yanofskybacteria bacterium RIFCSPHIGHO2_01_FULL_43_32]OGN11098.1 MAG: DNA polymerase I [Candidatus Yanofskybacteria bacterium RIFCSPHIGHO2_02_FULL_43_12]OGN24970.1 MAG: DNA polymerase I [Candidatus Yanofskybacteria bacterium RIFCSPLOWO2_01_FULL_43_46]OGN30131.1 MAG: DNA polymerase I [Candidatus Yanofskybacteria bacterium RIFCSPLOWO2_02_FULL_43_10]OGN34253.1 MAG: DNA polymerase I [Candidatus Yanofskybacteria bacterium RIFCSPLOWO2_12_FULL_43_11b]
MTKKLILIDGHALVHRAFHALPQTLASPTGVLTNAVYGFTAVLIKAIKDIKPDYIVATFDLAGPTFRHEEFAEYKAHREKAPEGLHEQVPRVKEVLTAFGVPIFEKAGFEADDVIGSVCEKTRKVDGLQTIIATGDLDTLQLVQGDKVVVLTLRKGVTDTVLYNEDEVKKRYGLEPEQMVDYKGLKGDPSDNIPGVPGIGEKTASALIQTFGSLDNLYEKISDFKFPVSKKDKAKIKPPLSEKLIQKLIENKEIAFFSRKLSAIIKDVDIDFKLEDAEWRKKMKKDEISRIFQSMGFYSLLKRVSEIDGSTPLTTGGSVGVQTSFLPLATTGPRVKELKTDKDVIDLLAKLTKQKDFALDVAEENIVFALESKECSFIPFDYFLKNTALRSDLKAVLENQKINKTGHDFKIISKYFLGKGIHLEGISFDSKIAAYLINSDLRDYSLDKIYFTELKQNMDSDPKKRPGFILELRDKLIAKLKYADTLWVFEKIELPLSIVLAEMELSGIKIDLNAISKLSKATVKELHKLENKIHKLAGKEFNINSPQQMSVILFEHLKITGKLKKTGKGAISTAAPELEKLSGAHPIIDLILKYRELQKLKTTYIEPFPALVDKNGRICTTFNQTGTATGRLSSEEPNLQNIPIRTDIGQEFRKVFIASPGYKLVSFDYSQLELRIAAHISKDKKMIEAFKRGEDIHTRTAAEIFGVQAGKVAAGMRRQAKVLNFGILYGMGVMGFQRASGADRAKAKEFIDRYMREFSGVARYMQEMKDKVRRDGYVTTIFGRRRHLPEAFSGMPQLISQAERMAINMPIQGTASDLIKLSMTNIHDLMHREKVEDKVKLLLNVHDELLFEVKDGLVKDWSVKIKNIMENIHKLDVPLIVDAKYGKNWAEMQDV